MMVIWNTHIHDIDAYFSHVILQKQYVLRHMRQLRWYFILVWFGIPYPKGYFHSCVAIMRNPEEYKRYINHMDQ